MGAKESDVIVYEAPVENEEYLANTVRTPQGSLQYIPANSGQYYFDYNKSRIIYNVTVSGSPADIGRSTSYVFIVSNGIQTVENWLIVRYVNADP
jgi:hypothetical protein